jgi:hypothetical protein
MLQSRSILYYHSLVDKVNNKTQSGAPENAFTSITTRTCCTLLRSLRLLDLLLQIYLIRLLRLPIHSTVAWEIHTCVLQGACKQIIQPTDRKTNRDSRCASSCHFTRVLRPCRRCWVSTTHISSIQRVNISAYQHINIYTTIQLATTYYVRYNNRFGGNLVSHRTDSHHVKQGPSATTINCSSSSSIIIGVQGLCE